MRDYENLKAFKLADELVSRVYEATEGVIERDGDLVDQLRRAALSGVTNIVEGSAKKSPANFHRYLGFAFGSRREVKYLLKLSHRLSYLSDVEYEELSKLNDRASATLFKLMKSVNEWED